MLMAFRYSRISSWLAFLAAAAAEPGGASACSTVTPDTTRPKNAGGGGRRRADPGEKDRRRWHRRFLAESDRKLYSNRGESVLLAKGGELRPGEGTNPMAGLTTKVET
jgi:hypothetical protein